MSQNDRNEIRSTGRDVRELGVFMAIGVAILTGWIFVVDNSLTARDVSIATAAMKIPAEKQNTEDYTSIARNIFDQDYISALVVPTMEDRDLFCLRQPDGSTKALTLTHRTGRFFPEVHKVTHFDKIESKVTAYCAKIIDIQG